MNQKPNHILVTILAQFNASKIQLSDIHQILLSHISKES